MLIAYLSLPVVGICGGVWRNDEGKDVRLGDVIVNKPDGNQSSIVRFGAGKEEKNGFKQGGALNKPLPRMVNAINLLRIKLSESNNVIQDHIDWLFEKHPHMRLKQTGMYGSFSRPGPHEDRLFDSEYDHVGGDTCDMCDPKRLVPRFARDNQDEVKIWYGSLGSDDRVMKNAKIRDAIAEQYSLLGFEMEAAGVMDDFNCTVVRGVCDYSDSHKTKKWQGFAAVAAAAYAKALLLVYVPRQETVQDLSRKHFYKPFSLKAQQCRLQAKPLQLNMDDGHRSSKLYCCEPERIIECQYRLAQRMMVVKLRKVSISDVLDGPEI